MLQEERIVRLDALVRGVFEDAIVKDFALLINLDGGGPLVIRGAPENRGQVLNVHVQRASNKSRLRTDGDREWPERIIDRAVGAGFGARALARGGRVLSLGQT